ncbi:MAG: hypothetical protein J0H80_01605 [Rhizobiales bacterium]|nr:hypothetical protein [Hyphomicrobiales bacterium]
MATTALHERQGRGGVGARLPTPGDGYGRQAGGIEAGAAERRHLARNGALAALLAGRRGRVIRNLQRSVAKRFGSDTGGRGGREHGYQQQKTGQRCAEKATSPTNRSML